MQLLVLSVRYTVIYDTHNRKVHTCLQLFIPSYREYIILSDNLQLNIHKHLRLLWLRTGLEAAILPDAESCYTFWVSRGRQLCKSRSSEAAAN